MIKRELYMKAIHDFALMMREVKAKKARAVQRGKYINVFSLWNAFSGITELVQSRILHFFLSDNPMHGQGYLFLQRFLARVGIEVSESDEWVVTAEKGRVDIMLKRFFPRSVVIIENKSNWAGDQLHQLYRYWYEHIHRCEEDCLPAFYTKHPEYQIIYLVPNKQKIWSDNSLERPSDYSNTLPAQLPMIPHRFSFDEEISDWLDECVNTLPQDNRPLIDLISQYRTYCKSL